MLKDCCPDVSSGYQGVTSCSARRSYFRWSYTASYFFPTCAKLKTWLGNYFSERCKSLLFIPGSPYLHGPCPHCPKTVSWAMLLKGLFKLSNTLYCRRNHAAGMPRRADAAHLDLPSSSAATTCCIGPNIHLRGVASEESGCNWNSFEARFVASCSVPAILNTPVICFQLSLVSLLEQWQKTRETVRFGNQFTYKDIHKFQRTMRVPIYSTPS